ncbi:MAG: hypothetical protein ACYC49_03875 [Ignavibacteriaceae bacterium]
MNTAKKHFRVLVVDDKKPVLQSIKDRVETRTVISGDEYNIELLLLHVEVLDFSETYAISKETIKELAQLCNKPFDLMLLDFGFVKEGISVVKEIPRLKNIDPSKSNRQLLDQVVLNPAHLIKFSEDHAEYSAIIEKNFTKHKGSLIIYTYIPRDFEKDYTSADVRKNISHEQFPKAKIKIIDARKELFNDDKFDKIHDEEKEYYPFLIAKYLSKVIQLEIAEKTIEKDKETITDLKKIKRNDRIITISTMVTSLITGFLIPGLSDSLQKGDYKVAFILFITMSMTVIIFTIGSKVLEKFN